MKKNKLFNNRNYSCFVFILTTTLAGCLSSGPSVKEKKVIGIQKKRIHQLEKQLAQKKQQLEKLKTHKWLRVKPQSQKALHGLKKKLREGQLVEALRESAQLKQKYPKSVELGKLRVMIFQKMGLKKQAQKEALSVEKIARQRTRRNRRRM